MAEFWHPTGIMSDQRSPLVSNPDRLVVPHRVSAVSAVVGYTVCGGAEQMLRQSGYAADLVNSVEAVTVDVARPLYRRRARP